MIKIFVSWSGKLSQDVAEILQQYIPCILQNTEVFTSMHDIASGSKWASELADALEKSSFGIICLTRENLQSPWLLYEAGALTKHAAGRACCLLIDPLTPADVSPPLSQFQNRRMIYTDLKKLIVDINEINDHKILSSTLEKLFEKFWSDIEKEYKEAISFKSEKIETQPIRDIRDVVDEILTRLRKIEINSSKQGEFIENVTADILSSDISRASLRYYTKWKFPNLPVSDYWNDRMFADMDHKKYKTLRDIDEVVRKAEIAVSNYAKELPSVFRYGTDYITKSLGFVDESFRSSHGFTVETMNAFQKFDNLISRSIFSEI